MLHCSLSAELFSIYMAAWDGEQFYCMSLSSFSVTNMNTQCVTQLRVEKPGRLSFDLKRNCSSKCYAESQIQQGNGVIQRALGYTHVTSYLFTYSFKLGFQPTLGSSHRLKKNTHVYNNSNNQMAERIKKPQTFHTSRRCSNDSKQSMGEEPSFQGPKEGHQNDSHPALRGQPHSRGQASLLKSSSLKMPFWRAWPCSISLFPLSAM